MRTALTLAGIVCVPADFRAVRCLRIVIHRIVTRRGNLFIGGMRTALALAGYVSIPAHFRAGRRFRFVLFQIVTRRNLYIGGIGAILAGIIGIPALFGAGGRFCFVLFQIMIVRIDFAGFQFAYCAGSSCNAGRLAEFVLAEGAKFYATKAASHLLFAGGFIAGFPPMVFPHPLAACSALHSMLRLSFVF